MKTPKQSTYIHTSLQARNGFRDIFFKPFSLRTKLMVTFLIIILIPLGLLAFLNNQVVVIITAGLLVGLVMILSRMVINPINRLTAVAQKVTGGNLGVRASIESQDEIGQLATVLNRMMDQLQGWIDSLEDQAQERTAELILSLEVGQKAATIRDLNELLPIITEYIREKFNLYYVQVYFVNDTGQKLVLKAGTGPVGQELLTLGHNLPVGLSSIVGRVAAESRSIVVPDTENSEVHLPNPLLPETRSELAVALMVEGRVIGVLDMQADQVNTFTTDNKIVFEAMATQLAISIDSAQQWTAAQQAQQKSQEAIRQLTRQSWAEQLVTQDTTLGFTYDLSTITPLETVGLPEPMSGGISTLVKVQQEPIGYLSVANAADQRWTNDEQALLEAVAEQLANKAENLRLFEVTQQRATREQLTRQITDKIRASRDIETALKTAAEELSKALGTSRAVIDLNIEARSE
jgi:GAF domain-containing protein/HAMP domain-containing protein